MNKDHGMTGRAEHTIWIRMRQRCGNPNSSRYEYYGGRGIKVCSRWEVFSNFLDDVGQRPSPEHSLDRIDNDGNYEPGNVKWSTRTEQARNRRSSRLITYNGETLTLVEWGIKTGIPAAVISRRIKRGWEAGEALTVPPVIRQILHPSAGRDLTDVPRDSCGRIMKENSGDGNE